MPASVTFEAELVPGIESKSFRRDSGGCGFVYVQLDIGVVGALTGDDEQDVWP